MPVGIGIGGLLEPGLRAEGARVYQPLYEGVKAAIGEIAYLELTSDKLQEIYGAPEAPLYFGWWPAETPIPAGTFKSLRYRLLNVDFGRRVNLPRNIEDDQTGMATVFARMISKTYAILPHEIFAQIMTGTSYNSTTAPYPFLPNAGDGSALYLTTTRYGVTAGNVVSVTGTSTVQQIITDLMSVVQRFQDFQNTQGRPFFDPVMARKFTLFHGTAVTLVMNQAEFQTRTPWEQTTGANGTGQTPTNLLQDSRLDIKYVPLPTYISNSRYYCWMRGLDSPQRAYWRQVRKGYTEWQGNFITSDLSRDFGGTYVQADCREGHSPGLLAISTVRVS